MDKINDLLYKFRDMGDAEKAALLGAVGAVGGAGIGGAIGGLKGAGIGAVGGGIAGAAGSTLVPEIGKGERFVHNTISSAGPTLAAAGAVAGGALLYAKGFPKLAQLVALAKADVGRFNLNSQMGWPRTAPSLLTRGLAKLPV